ncbi:DUF1398 domain-containing protein [Pedobacter sp. MW01-1-1]|uniref:DUF1398 domain-containing protein n=1 Tax=Pedobacter sp. MW01-1-1 TaxID=3383027 RepID=UPI003FEE89F7
MENNQFTLDEIKATHAKVKSGADFPKYIADLKKVGVLAYEHYVTDGHTAYLGNNDYRLLGASKWPTLTISTKGEAKLLRSVLRIHQNGGSDYITFCRESAEAGVEKWVVDLNEMTCSYYDLDGNALLVETIPTV